ncbi:MAG: pre-peptidase C-terminal domain-containing protein, partial [Pirellulales bacterium]
MRFTAVATGEAGNGIELVFNKANLGVNTWPAIRVSGREISITLNTNSVNPTQAGQMVSAINAHAAASQWIRATLRLGDPAANIADVALGYSPLVLTGGDVQIMPGYLGFGDNDSIVVARFAEPLPADEYRIEVFGFDDPARGVTGLRDSGGVLFEPAVEGADRDRFDFSVELGAQIVAVVPQPVFRTAGGLQQDANKIVLYFNEDDLDPVSAQDPRFYQLIDTGGTRTTEDDAILLPSSVRYDPGANSAVLEFARDLPDGMYQLRVGPSDESNDTVATASRLGTLFNINSNSSDFGTVAFSGDENGNNDVDLYEFKVPAGGATLTITATPVPGHDTLVRLLQPDGTEIDSANDGGPGVADTLVANALAAGTYYLGISSSGNAAYNIGTAASGTGGTTSGSYRLAVDVDNPTPTADDNNSSFETAADLGSLGTAPQTLQTQIEPQTTLLLPALPGGNDEPGHRSISAEDHLGEFAAELGTVADVTPGIPVFLYNFQDNYGVDPQGNTLLNAITENQKDRAREVFELYGSSLGVQFQEVDCAGISGGSCAGLTVATGDIRAVDPNLPPQGPSGIMGNGKVVVNGTLNFGNSEYGGLWFNIAMHEIGHAIGLGHSYDVPSIMGSGLTGEP